MSEINISFEGLFQQDIDDEWDLDDDDIDDEENAANFIPEIVCEIIDKAIATAESNSVAQSVLEDILNDVAATVEGIKVDFRSSSESEYSSQSSYRVPSYLAIRSHLDSVEDVVEVEGEHTCAQYGDIDKYAGTVIDQILEQAVGFVSMHGSDQISRSFDSVEESSDTSASTVVEWPAIETFTVEAGMSKIYEFMDTWDYDEDWLYCVDFLTQQSDECSDYYKYEARWSIPTQMYPIPQATASIYFTIECSRVKPQDCPVSVTYIYEGTSFVHTLESVFSEDRLFEIVDSKLKFYQRLTF